MAAQIESTDIVNHLIQQFGLERDQIVGMLPTFYKAVFQYQDELVASLEGGDLEQIGRLAHRLKGALLNLGLTKGGDYASSIEHAARLGDTTFDYKAACLSLENHLCVLRKPTQ